MTRWTTSPMKYNKLLLCVILCLTQPISVDAQQRMRSGVEATEDMSVCPERGTWSEEPASRWEDAMVSGNGCMGLTVFGDPEADRADHRPARDTGDLEVSGSPE